MGDKRRVTQAELKHVRHTEEMAATAKGMKNKKRRCDDKPKLTRYRQQTDQQMLSPLLSELSKKMATAQLADHAASGHIDLSTAGSHQTN
ncbi:hypothetical protein BaRGS_00028907 [Batillaria attramentaria]|uniref:Ribosome biogenesis protein SLX9 n=1 Tax=Batillaria attramentaria TaxID=370345 RepID=A0ABD0JXQ0_9CAEN